jgi:DNA-binding transcriptional LysR family regulator
MGVELRDLKWALVAAQHRSLRQASAALNIRQSTLSRCLDALEHTLGATLFERTNGGTRPTAIGHEFLDAAAQVFRQTDEIAARLRSRSRGEMGRLNIGVHAAMSAGNLRATLIEHRTRLPDVDIHLVDGSGDELVAALLNSTVDVAFVSDSDHAWEGLALPVWSERVVVALPDEHNLNNHEFVTWSDISQEAIMLPQRGPGPELRRLVTANIGCSNSHWLCHDVSLDRLLTLVGAGWGILLALEGATGAILLIPAED